jgi:hypothetical protein
MYILQVRPFGNLVKSYPPPFVKKLPSRLQPEQVQFLNCKGALTIPSRWFLQIALAAYVDYVHPYMPILDLGHFLHTIAANNSQQTVSIFLLQAVLFASSAFIPETCLEPAGFTDRRAVQRTFYRRAKVLFSPFISLGTPQFTAQLVPRLR